MPTSSLDEYELPSRERLHGRERNTWKRLALVFIFVVAAIVVMTPLWKKIADARSDNNNDVSAITQETPSGGEVTIVTPDSSSTAGDGDDNGTDSPSEKEGKSSEKKEENTDDEYNDEVDASSEKGKSSDGSEKGGENNGTPAIRTPTPSWRPAALPVPRATPTKPSKPVVPAPSKPSKPSKPVVPTPRPPSKPSKPVAPAPPTPVEDYPFVIYIPVGVGVVVLASHQKCGCL
jgi:hypothetical protein